jgi:heme-degrading monooxygenase HmoA
MLRRVAVLALAAALLLPASAAGAAPVHQLRIYELDPAKTEVFHARFRDHAARIMKRHGFRIVAMWEASSPKGPEFVYLLEWPDEAAMKAGWAAFMADKEWSDIKAATRQRHGAIMGGIEDRTLRLTDYSAPLPARR